MNFISSMLVGVMSLDWLMADFTLNLPVLLAETSLLTRWSGYFVVGLQVAAGLGFVIFVHELGHFMAAKTFGVKCEKFYVGFDIPMSIGPIKLPRTLGRFRWGETEYGIGIVPLGGYVKMLGQDDDPRNAEAEAERVRLGGGPDAPLDPRSYQAKPVWQRMIIISAGVVMNVIFAVFLAAAAFLYGVPYTPTTIGGTPAGSPGWVYGLQAGDHIKQVARMTRDDEYFRFEDMATKTAIQGMKKGAKPIPFTVDRDGQRVTIDAIPSKELHPDGFFMVGINPATVAIVSDAPDKYSYLASQKVDVRKGDRIIAADGEPLPIDKDSNKILSYSLTNKFQAKWNKPVEITVLRKVPDGGSEKTTPSSDEEDDAAPRTEVKITLPPVPVKTLGLGFAMGKITAIRQGSMAESAGIKVGDVIEKVDGAEIKDAFQLPMQVAEKIGKPLVLTVRRPASPAADPKTDKPVADNNKDQSKDESSQLTFTLQSTAPPAFGVIGNASARLSLENYGIAYSVLPVVSWVDPDATKAASQVTVGEELTQFKIELSDQERKEFEKNGLKVSDEAQVVTAVQTLTSFLSGFQNMPEGTKIRCYLKRNGNTREVVLPLYYAKDWYWILRGVPMTPLQKIQKTEEVGQAFSWGVTETGRKLTDVFEFLTILVTGRASPRNLAGPFEIARVASHEASDSPSRLLLFLTLLSANLAILNFLPIPALDGGHLMFLTWEAIRGKPLNETMQVRLTMVGVMCLLGLMAFAILNDFLRVMK